MSEKITFPEFGPEQSKQFEETYQFAPEQFFQEAKSIYNKSLSPIHKGIENSQIDILFNARSANRAFASFPTPHRIQENFFLLNASQPMQTIQSLDKLTHVMDLIDEKKGASPQESTDLKNAFNVASIYFKDAQQIHNQVISVGKG